MKNLPKIPLQNQNTPDSSQNSSSFVQIGQAAKILGISKDTLRRWEAAGKINSVRTASGYRLYDLNHVVDSAKKAKKLKSFFKPQPIVTPINNSLDTSSLTPNLESSFLSKGADYYGDINLDKNVINSLKSQPALEEELESNLARLSVGQATPSHGKPVRLYSFFTKRFLTTTFSSGIVVLILAFLLTNSILASYFISPVKTKGFFKASDSNKSIFNASKILSPFNKVAVKALDLINPGLVKTYALHGPPGQLLPEDLIVSRSLSTREVSALQGGQVLAESTEAGRYIQFNLPLDGTEASFSASVTAPNLVYSLVPGNNITVTGDPQNPTISTDITLEDASTTVKGIASFSSSFFTVAQGAVSLKEGGITDKEIKDGSITNADLTNNSITVTAGSGLSGGGSVALGGSITLKATSQGLTVVDLTSDVTGVLPIANGGTGGAVTPTAGAIAYGTGTAYAFSAAGTTGQCLTSAGAATPTWGSCGGGGGMSSFIVAGDSGTSQTITDGNTFTVVGGTNIASVASATDTITLNLDDSITLTGTITANTTNTINGLSINSGALSGITGFTQSSGAFSTTLTTTNSASFSSTTANTDTIAIKPQVTTTTASFTGTLTSVDLTGTHTWTLPNADGTFAVSATGPVILSAAGDIGCTTCVVSGGSLWTAGATSGTTTQTVSQGGTLTFTAGTDITTTGSAGVITIADTSTLATVTGRGATTTTLVNLDGGIAVDTSNFTVSGTTGAISTVSTLNVDSSSTLNAVTIDANANFAMSSGTGTFTQNSTATGGGDFSIVNTGVATAGTIAALTANSATTGDIMTISGTALSSGTALTLIGPSGGTAGVTDAALKITSDVGNIGTSNGLINSTAVFDGSSATGVNLYLSSSDAIASANTDYGIYNTVTNTGAIDSAIIKNSYGNYTSVSSTLGAPTTAGTTNVYGQYITTTATHAANFGTVNNYGLYIANGTSSTNGTSTKYGINIDDQSGADTNIDLNFTASPIVRIGDAGVLTFTEAGGNNTLCTLTDNANKGDLACTGSITGSSSGTVGFWTRTSTTLSPATGNDIVSIANTTTTGADLAITNTGIYTGTGLTAITANSATSGDILTVSGTALTSGSLAVLTGPSGGTAGVTDAALKITSDVGNIGTSNGLISSTATIDSTANAISGVNLYLNTASSQALGTTVGQDYYGIYNTLAKTGADTTSGTINSYGVYSTVSNTGGDTAGTRNTYGGYFSATGDASGTTNAYGLYAAATGGDNNYGLYINSATGTGISIANTGITTDISLQNAETIDNNVDGTITLTATTTKTSGDLTVNGNDINDSGGTSAVTFDGSTNTQLNGNLTMAANKGITFTAGTGNIAHNYTSNTGTAYNMVANSLSSGEGFYVSSTSNGFINGHYIKADVQPGAVSGDVSGSIAQVYYTPTYSTAVTTPTISGNALNVTRITTTNNNFASTLTISGAALSVTDTFTKTTGTQTITENSFETTRSCPSGVTCSGAVGLLSGSGAGTDTYGLNITKSAGTMTNGINIGTTTQAITNGLVFGSTGITTDITLQNGETIDNNTDGTVNILANSGAPTLLLTSATANDDKIALTPKTGGANSFTATISSADLTVGSQTFNLPDLAAASSATICVSGTTCASSGTVGYWSRTSTTLSPATANDIVSIANTTTTGADLAITNTGIYTGTGIFNLTANSATTGNIVNLSATGMTTGELLNIDSTYAPSNGSDNEAIDVNLTFTPTSSAATFRGLDLNVTEGSNTLTNTIYGQYNTTALTGNAAKTGTGIYQTVTSASTTGDTLIALDLATSATGIVGSGNRNSYGLRSQPASTGASTAGTNNVYGVYSAPSSTLANGSTENVYGGYYKATGTVASGTVTSYGLYIANPTMNTTGTSTKIGLHIEDLATTGPADNNYGICFDCDGTYSSSTAVNGITWGSDANLVTLYRSASDTLKTDDSLSVATNFDQAGGTGTFATGTGTVSLNGATTLAANKNFVMSSGTGTFTQNSTATGGGDFSIVNTGVATAGTVAALTANSLTSGDVLTISATAATSGSLLTLTGPSGGTAGVTDAALKITSDVGNIGTSNGLINSTAVFDGSSATGVNLYLTSSDAIAAANTDYGIYNTVTNTGAIDSAIVKNSYGSYTSVSSTLGAPTTAGTTNVYGEYIITTATHAANFGTVNNYGLYVANGTSSTNGTSTKYGINIDDQSGADTNIDLNFTGSPIVRIGDAGVLTFTEAGGNNTLCTLTDNTNKGDLTCTGNITGSSSGTVGFWTRTSTTLSPATGNDVVSITSNDTSNPLLTLAPTGVTGKGLSISALSGTTANTGIQVGAISGASATGTGVDIGAFTNTGATQYGANIGAFSGTHAAGGGTTAGVNIGNISSAGTTSSNYGILLGTMTGGTTANYQISTGILTSATTTTNAQINLGGVVTTNGTSNYGVTVGALSGTGTTNTGFNLTDSTSTGTTTGVAIGALSGAGTANNGVTIGALSGATTSKGITIGAMSSATSTGIDIGAFTGATTNTGINITSFATGTTSKGIVLGTNSSATGTGIDIGALSGTTANIGVKVGAISGASATGTGVDIGAFTNTGATQYGVNIGAFSGTHAAGGGTTAGINIGNISSAGTTSSNYGLLLGTMTGGTTANYQISTGILTSATTTTNAQINLGGVVTTGGTTNYGITVGALSGTGTTNKAINIDTLTSTGTTSTALNIGGLSGAATNNNGIAIGAISGNATTTNGISLSTITGGAATTTINGISTGTLTASATSSTDYHLNLGATVGATTSTFGAINTGAISGVGTQSAGIVLGANSSTATTNYGITIGAISGAGTTNTGLNIAAVSGATTNYAIKTAQGSVDITDNSNTVPSLQLTNNTITTLGAGINTTGLINFQSTSLTTGNLVNIQEAANALTTGTLLNVSTTSTGLLGTATTGKGLLANLDWSPGSATTATGDLFRLAIGTNGTTTGSLFNIVDTTSSIFSVSEVAMTTSLPANFTAAGDTSIAYDINFTNPTASYIKSAAPLNIYSGETFNSSNLNLGTYNQGTIVFDTANTTTTALDLTNSLLTTGIGLNIATSALTTGQSLSITTGGATALTSGSGILITGPTGAAAISNNSGLLKIITSGALTGTSGSGTHLDIIGDSTITATLASISDSSIMTGAGQLLSLTAAAATTTTTGLFNINAAGLSSGAAAIINVNGAAVLTTGNAIKVVGPTGAANMNATTGLVNITSTGAITNTTAGAASGSLFQINGNGAITPTLASISDTSIMTTTGKLLDLTANAATTTTGLLTLNATGITTGSALNIVGSTSTGVTSGTTSGFVKIASDVGSGGVSGGLVYLAPDFSSTSAIGSNGLKIAATDATNTANQDFNINSVLTLTGNAAKVGYAVYGNITDNSTTASGGTFGDGTNGVYAGAFITSDTGVVVTGTDNTYGVFGSATRTGSTTAGTINTAGGYFTATGDNGGAGTTTVYGVYASASGGDTNYPFYSGVAFPNDGSTAALCWDNSGASAILDCTTPLADYAEVYPVETGVDYGEIVVVGPTEVISSHVETDDKGNALPSQNTSISKLAKSSLPYQSNIIGITSKNWADFSSIGHGSIRPEDNPMPVALSGRVPLKVSTENGLIKAGDFLTSSSTPGVAMKATQPGQTIGKALADYSDPGIGRVLVFVNVGYADPSDALAHLLIGSEGQLLTSDFKANKITVSSDINIGGLVKAAGVSIDASSINRVGALASIPVSPDNKVSLADAINSINTSVQSQESRVLGLEQSQASSAAALASAQSLGQQAVASVNSLDEKVASTSSSLASLQTSISDLMASLGLSSKEASSSSDPISPELVEGLTPVEQMFATGSAKLANLEVTSEATFSGKLTAYQGIFQDSLKSLGDTFLGKTIVAGDLTIDGTLAVTNGNTIDSIGTLFLQKSVLAEAVDIFNGLITITKDGVIKAKEIVVDQIKVTADSVNPQNNSAGSSIIPAGAREIAVFNTLIKPESIVILTPETITSQPLAVSDKVAGSGFVVKLAAPTITDIKFNYLIIGQKEVSN